MSADVSEVQAAWYSNPSAERAVISLCLQSMTSFIDASAKLDASDFLDSGNRALFTVLSSLSSVGVGSFDLPSVASAVGDLGLLDSIGGFKYLDALYRSEISKDNLDIYVNQVLDSSLMFKLEKKLKESVSYVREAGNNSKAATEILSRIEDGILSLSLETMKIEDGKHISDGILELLASYEAEPSTVRGLRSGFPILDRILNGFEPGGLYVVGARPKMGKSMLLSNWATHICAEQSIPVLYIDTEMTFKENYQPRMLSHLSGVPERVIKNGLYLNDKKQHEAVYYAAEVMKRMNFIHKYMPGFRMEDVRSVVRKYHARNKIGALFFDYIKMVELNDNYNETQTLGYLTSSLKDLAGQLGIPVVTAVQINRAGEGKSHISSDQIADSDRVLRYCNTLMALAPKSKSEIESDGQACGTHRLQILDNRGGSSFYSGIDLMSYRSIITLKEAETQSSDSILEQKRVQEEKAI